MKKIVVVGVLCVALLCGCDTESDEITTSEVVVTEVVVTEVPVVTEIPDTDRLGVSEAELYWIEHSMRRAGWDYDRTDFERVYRLKDEEMFLNPAIFAEYEVTIKGGKTHEVTLNKSLLEGGEDNE